MFACEETFCYCLRWHGAWMFVKMLIRFHCGKLLHYQYALFLGKVMPNFSATIHVYVHGVVLKYSLLLYVYRVGNHGHHDERRASG
jgi:hypothetical protein